MNKVLIIVNHELVVYNFRKELVEELLNEGNEVIICSPNGEKISKLKTMGAKHIDISIEARSTNPFLDIKLYKNYKRIIKEVCPDIVLTYTIKPNIYGGLAAQKLNVPYIANITGLGTAIENKGLLQKIILSFYKKAFKNINTVFFQNKTNMDFFIEKKISNKENYKLLPGSGVNLDKFIPLNYDFEDNDKVVITYLGRIMKNKGMGELLEAIETMNNERVLFNITGYFEDESYKDKIIELEEKGLLVYHNQVFDVIPIIKKSQGIINPTYHEGMSNLLLEAAASARPVLASNIPGCKEIFDDGISGFAFEPKNVDSLIEAINKFLSLSIDERREMGLNGRTKVEKEFDRKYVIDSYIDEIKKIIK